MHLLFIIDPLPQLKAYKDSSVAIMRAFMDLGHKVSVCLQADLYVEKAQVLTSAQTIAIDACADLHSHTWWNNKGCAFNTALSQFDGIVMRKDPPFDMEYLYSTHLLQRAQTQGALVFNSGAAIRDFPEKLSILEFPQYTTPTLISRQLARIKAFYEEYGDIVLKPLDGMGGTGIFRVKTGDANFNSIVEVLTLNGQQTIMAQKFIPAITAGDKRILIINGQPIPYVLARIPQKGENRGNLAAGGLGVAQPITEYDKKMAEHVGQTLAGRGLFLIGLDVIGENITEINVTSPTCFVEITEQTGFDVPMHFAQALVQTIAELRG